MKIHEKIKEDLKKAMLAKDAVKVSVLRGLQSGFMNELSAKGKGMSDIMEDTDSLTVLKRAFKQRKDSIEQFEKGGRADLAKAEKAELKILEEYMPKMMSETEIKKIVDEKIKQIGKDSNKIGMIVGAVMKECKGNADGNLVKKVVETLFASK